MAEIQKESNYKISIVIGTLNRPEVLKSLLDQLADQPTSLSFEVIVIDQSTEEYYKINLKNLPIKSHFKIIRLEIPNTCKYLNLGWKNAHADIVLYLDDDVSITDETITSHINSYENDNVLGVAGRVINDNEVITTDSRVGKIYFNGAIITKNFTFTQKTFVDFPYGCNMSFRKNILEKIGGFDENIQPPIYAYNEIDMGVRISKRWPHSLLFEPKALVYHHQYKTGGTRTYNPREYKKAVNRNYGYFIGKNYSYLENFVYFIRRIPFQLLKEADAIPDIVTGFIYAKKTQ